MRLCVTTMLLMAGLACERGRTMHLEHPIGIITIGDVFTEIIPSGVEPPH